MTDLTDQPKLPSLRMRADADPPYFFQEKVAQFLAKGQTGRWEVTHPVSGEVARISVVASSPGRGILYIDPGLGKSRMAIDTCTRLDIDLDKKWQESDFILVLCSKKALNTWRREWAKWTHVNDRNKDNGLGDAVVIVEAKGTQPGAKRRKLWERYKSGGRIFVVTYQSGALDLEAERIPKELLSRIKIVIADEAKIWINRKTKNFKTWQSYIHKVPYFIPMDGTLIKKGPQDLWTFYNLIKPKTFTSYWRWVNTFCNVIDAGFGQQIIGPKNTEGFGQLMRHTLIKLKDDDEDVKGSRPPLTRDFKLVEMTDEQRHLYESLTNDLLAITPSGQIIATPSQMALSVRQRQILICPKLLDPHMGYGSAIEHLLENMEDDPHHVVFTPFAKAIPFIVQAMVGAGYPTPYTLQGGTDSRDVRAVEEGFNLPANAHRACICTIGFAESFELWSAKQCAFIGYDWMQITNYQAEKRLHRLITPHPVNAWYYRYLDTVDDLILDKLNSNVINTKISFQDYRSALNRLRSH